MIVASVAALFFLFNAGQLSSEKTKLVNTADAVAYSVGVMDARTLNFLAYTNRAMLANTVAIAQLVSLSSWTAYIDQLSQTGSSIDWWGKYIAAAPSWEIVQLSASELNLYLNDAQVLETLAEKSDQIFIKKVLVNAQAVAYAGLLAARPTVMDEVARANYRNDGTVAVQSLLSSAVNFSNFVQTYEDDERTRFAEAAVAAAKSDGFVKHRSWILPSLTQGACFAILPDWIERRGGTELIGFDEWKAMDTLSEHVWVVTEEGCAVPETPAGFATTVAADDTAADTDWRRYDYSRLFNLLASPAADSSSISWGYTGLPKFYDLSEDRLEDEEDPRLRYAVGLKRRIAATRTSEGVAQVRNSGSDNRLATTLNNYRAAPAEDDAMAAASAVEVYFDRGSDNPYGNGKFGKPKEIGSLFNPYWHVHLVSASAAERAAALGSAMVLP
ncbi:MAG: hypothetical protein HZC22_15235 [Rhodocyclales bacterium]|nr:hypothetical protein [Rhodocyclales bacterium]